jgi:hypothetical protein
MILNFSFRQTLKSLMAKKPRNQSLSHNAGQDLVRNNNRLEERDTKMATLMITNQIDTEKTRNTEPILKNIDMIERFIDESSSGNRLYF